MGVIKPQSGAPIALRHSAEVRSEPRASGLSSADLSNVIPFARPRALRQAPTIAPPPEPRPAAAGLGRERARLLAFAALALAVHGGLLWAASREPIPLASIGEEVMSVEIVVGATAPAGVAQAPGEQDAQAAAVPDTQQPEPQREPEQPATGLPQTVQVAPEEKAPEQTTQLKAAQPEPQPAIAMVGAPKPDEATARPAEIPPDTPVITLLPQPEERLAERKPEAKPVQAQPAKPVQHATPAKKRRRIEAPTKDHLAKQAKASVPSTAANNVGVGRSDSNSNYAGLVSAHLRRHQQYPADARSRNEQGSATVSFNLDGGGRVTAARLVRGSGIASIDQEVQAMVRRASPFPPPPSGRAVSFTVPVSFRLN